MKPRVLKTLLIIQFVVIALILMWFFYELIAGNKETELLREISPDGNYEFLIKELGKPTFFLFPIDRFRVYLCENTNNKERYVVSFRVDVRTGGGTADYKIEWLEDSVQIVLSGLESHYYILPFKTLEDSKRDS